jgi:FtsP/CotA-like multicopper oxidase with cupredoxin domain
MKRIGLMLMIMSFAVSCKKQPSVAAPSPAIRASALAQPPQATDLAPAANLVRINLTAAAIPGSDGQAYRYAYNGSVPGPTIRAKMGDTLEVVLNNQLGFATTIHWHGVSVPWEMDGVTWMRDPIADGDTFTYRFTLNQVGTFWYHPHFNTEHQVDGGLYGMLVIEDPAEPPVDEELVLVFDSAYEDKQPHGAHGHGKKITHWRVNGERLPSFVSEGGRIVRARMVNVSNVGFLALRWPSIRQIGADQGLLPSLQRPERIVLAPGDRADALLYIGEDPFTITTDIYSLNGGDALGDAMEILKVEIQNPAPVTATITWPFSGETVTPDPGHTDIVYAFAGSDRTEQWFINGEKFPNITIERIELGSTKVIEVRNLSPTEHPFHLHGLDFEVLSINGVPPPYKMIEDTFTLKIRDRVRLLVHANNPGDWMTHCHILPHAGDGMMTVLRVE